MTLGLAFWVLMLVWFVLGLAWNTGLAPTAYAGIGNTLLLFMLFLLLGWHAFGPPIHG